MKPILIMRISVQITRIKRERKIMSLLKRRKEREGKKVRERERERGREREVRKRGSVLLFC